MKDITFKIRIISGIIFIALLSACATRPVIEPDSKPLPESDSETLPSQVNTEALKHFMDGEVFMMQGNFAMAILEYQDALEYDPSASTIITSLAEAYMRLGKFEKGEKHLLQALNFNPKDRSARELLGHHYLVRNRINNAEEQYRFLNNFYPEELEYQYILAEITLRKGDVENAQRLFWKIYENNPSEERALFRAGEIARERKDFPFAMEAYEHLIKINSEKGQYWRIFSELALILQDIPKAITGLEKLLVISDQAPEILEKLSILYYDHGNTKKADSILIRLYNDDIKSPGILYYLGRIALDNDDYESLESYSKELVDAYPEVREGYTNLALAYINLDRNLNAISVLLEARERFPGDYTINFLLGNSYNVQENYILAKSSLLTALKVVPDSRSAMHLLATVYNQLEEWDHSDGLYQNLLDSDTNDGQALNNYSYTLALRETRLPEALQMAQKAIELEPGNAAYFDTIGWIYFKLLQHTKAAEYIRKSLDIESGNAVVLEHMGDVLIKLSRDHEAVKYYKEAMEIGTENETVREKVRNLEKESE